MRLDNKILYVMKNTVIKGTGCYIPEQIVRNTDFEDYHFYDEKQQEIPSNDGEITQKFEQITGIRERRYVCDDKVVSDIAAVAAKKAVEDAGIDAETIDQIIVAHNYGDVQHGTIQSDAVPSIAARVKNSLGIQNSACIAYDILFGCPGWVQAVIQAHAYIRAGMGKRFLIIGAETLSRVVDKYDRDTMIYADGAGAVILEAEESDTRRGLLSYAMQTDTMDEAHFLFAGESYNPNIESSTKYIKMYGRKVYEYAISNVPQAMKLAMDRSGESVEDLKKVLIHQANEKMDEAILKRFYRLYKLPMPEGIMPMTIQKLGNSSVATIPTLLDLILKGELEGHSIKPGDLLLFASVGAGMSINAFVYRW
jgi:3-oxoacyl-[acyl-carrier-protein] synthase-3